MLKTSVDVLQPRTPRRSPGMTRRVLVVGAGVAGLATARALRGAGFEATVVERRPGAPLPGLGLNLPGNAVRALDALGVAEQVLAAGIPVTRREYRTARGRLLFAVDESSYWADVAPSVCVRPGLVLDALGAGQEVRRGVGVVRVDTSPHRPHVALSDGSEEICDLVVGADGVHSTVRGAVVTTTPRASVMTTASWRFVVPNPGVDCWTAWTGGGLALLLIPVHAGEAYGYASSSKGGAAGADPRWLAQAFARFPTPARRALEAALEKGRAALPLSRGGDPDRHLAPGPSCPGRRRRPRHRSGLGTGRRRRAGGCTGAGRDAPQPLGLDSGRLRLGTAPTPTRRPRTGGDGPDVAPGQASRLSIAQPGSLRWPPRLPGRLRSAARAALNQIRYRPIGQWRTLPANRCRAARRDTPRAIANWFQERPRSLAACTAILPAGLVGFHCLGGCGGRA